MKVELIDHKVYINGKHKDFGHYIYKAEYINDLYIVTFSPEKLAQEDKYRNVFAFDKDFKKVWQIEGIDVQPDGTQALFAGTNLGPTSRRTVTTTDGYVYFIDPLTGKILGYAGWTK
ncbi:MAG: hypothetical protein ACOYOK_01305 [Pseudobdellovibrionaceae bacterium]